MNIIKTVKPFLTKYKPELMISCGISGFIATSILNVGATVKAVRLIDSEKEKLGRNLSNKEVIKLCWKCYLPSVLTAGISIPCIIIGNSITNKRSAALAAAYTVAETSLQTFKEETSKALGEEKFKELENKVSQRKLEEAPAKPNNTVIFSGEGATLFYDEYSGRYFKSTWNELQKIANELNAKALAGGDTITMSEWYDEIGLSGTLDSDNIGWNVFNGARGLIDISLDSCISPDNQPCGVIRYNNEPKVLFA